MNFIIFWWRRRLSSTSRACQRVIHFWRQIALWMLYNSSWRCSCLDKRLAFSFHFGNLRKNRRWQSPILEIGSQLVWQIIRRPAGCFCQHYLVLCICAEGLITPPYCVSAHNNQVLLDNGGWVGSSKSCLKISNELGVCHIGSPLSMMLSCKCCWQRMIDVVGISINWMTMVFESFFGKIAFRSPPFQLQWKLSF